MRTLMLLSAAALILSACDQSEPAENQPQPAKARILVQGPGQRRMHELDTLNRAIALKRAIYDSGFVCKRITESGFVQEYNNLSMWAAKCADGKAWAVFISPNDQVQVRDCADNPKLRLPGCYIDWDKTKR